MPTIEDCICCAVGCDCGCAPECPAHSHRFDGEVRLPAEWERLEGIVVIDPDGWRHDGKGWGDPIRFAEWERRSMVSTVGPASWRDQ